MLYQSQAHWLFLLLFGSSTSKVCSQIFWHCYQLWLRLLSSKLEMKLLSISISYQIKLLKDKLSDVFMALAVVSFFEISISSWKHFNIRKYSVYYFTHNSFEHSYILFGWKTYQENKIKNIRFSLASSHDLNWFLVIFKLKRKQN